VFVGTRNGEWKKINEVYYLLPTGGKLVRPGKSNPEHSHRRATLIIEEHSGVHFLAELPMFLGFLTKARTNNYY
jgi:hypothetical protein